MHPVETYLNNLRQVHSTGGGTKERSYYGVLENLLNEVGKDLRPKVRCIQNLKDTGAGEPDFGLYSANQFQRVKDAEPLPDQLPERGVIEVKGWADDTFLTAKTSQVSKYWKKYGLVLVTNYRDFLLVGRDKQAKPIQLEMFRLAETEESFLSMLARPRKTAKERGDRLVEFLCRVMLHAAPIDDPEDVAWFLASYAREARVRVEASAELPALAALRKGLEEALGLTFKGEEGKRFFHATLVQTLFYGIFSSWVLWAREQSHQEDTSFNWHDAAWTLHVPMIASLFSQIATPKRLKPLGLSEILDWTGMVLNRVDHASFFQKFEEENAVQYFYEPFLKAYDPKLRKALGVWYTPTEIVKYQVERIDSLLREELGLLDGLADEQVVILDPCCGTGAYLVETLKKMHATLKDKGDDALVAHRLKRAAMERVFGFEILPAPFVVSHLQLGLMLHQLGTPLSSDSDERVGVYLTNALTGWEPPSEPKDQLPLFPELMEEREAANKVKCEAPILVILGNPPYNAFAGTSPEEEGGIIDLYKEGLTTPVKEGGWGIRKFNLDDLYIRFFRIAERRIKKSGKGIVSYISNFSYLSDPSFVVMRKRILNEFDEIWIDCMNGDSRETGKRTPEGKSDPSVFSTEQDRAGIRVGTAICLMVRKEKRHKKPTVRFQHYWGVTKRQDLLDSLFVKNFDQRYRKAKPEKANRHSIRPQIIDEYYLEWPLLSDVSGDNYFAGIGEDRGKALISIDKEPLESRMRMYFDSGVSWETLSQLDTGLTKDVPNFDAEEVRKKVIAEEKYQEDRLQEFAMRPFDVQWCYYVPIGSLWRRARPQYWKSYILCDSCVVSRFNAAKSREGSPIAFARQLCDYHMMPPNSSVFPARIRHQPEKAKSDNQRSFFGDKKSEPEIKASLSEKSREYLESLGITNCDENLETAELIWMHILAIGYSSAYLNENADGIRQDYPRIPLPGKKKNLLESAELGRRVAAFLDIKCPVKGVTCGKIQKGLKKIAVVSKIGGGTLNPDRGHLDLIAGWGYINKSGACMPGQGKTEEREVDDSAQKELFGDKAVDVFLNDTAYWANIPLKVWEYTIGGYQVIKKWLSYREREVVGRSLKIEEAEYVTEMARRIAALILLGSELDRNYQSVKRNTWAWPRPR